ncbi:MAG: hypothetical protein ACQEQ0_13825 [Bacteroidota bacterium]
MSYEKITETIDGDSTDVIRFYYPTDDIFDLVAAETAQKAKSVVVEGEGKPDFDRVAVTSDEKNYIRKYMKEAMLEVFSPVSGIIVDEKITHDEEFTLDGGGTETGSFTFVVDNDRSRTITLDLLDHLIENSLVDFILFKWYVMKGLTGDAELHMGEFRNNLVRIIEKSMVLRQPKG